jgi:hypothetical protein
VRESTGDGADVSMASRHRCIARSPVRLALTVKIRVDGAPTKTVKRSVRLR